MAPATSNDPIAGVRLWALLPALFVVSLLVFASFDEPEPERIAYDLATQATVIAWWYYVVADATRRAGHQPVIGNVRDVLKLSAAVALCGLMAKLLWMLLQHVLQLPRLGFVEGPKIFSGEPTAQSVGVTLVRVALLGPVAEELLFRGGLFRKWRIGRLGPTKAALLTSALFGLGHSSAPTATLFAISATVLYTTTRTIWAPIVAHVLNNLFVVALGSSAHLWPLALIEATSDWRVHLAALVPALAGTLWLGRFLYRGWHTLGAPVDGVVPPDGDEEPPPYRIHSPTTSPSDTPIATATR